MHVLVLCAGMTEHTIFRSINQNDSITVPLLRRIKITRKHCHGLVINLCIKGNLIELRTKNLL